MYAKIYSFLCSCAQFFFAFPLIFVANVLHFVLSFALPHSSSNMNGEKSTEVKASEEAKGGIKYELVLSAPVVDSPKHVVGTPPRTSLSMEDIEKKLIAAEERKKSVDLQKLHLVTEKATLLEAAKEKREEFNQNFIQAAKESLVHRQESMKENREQHIKTIQEKAREIVMKVDEKRKNDDTPEREKLLEKFNKKLMTAHEIRESNLNSLKERLKEHDKHIAEVKKQMEEQTEEVKSDLREKSVKKLEIAQAKRETILREIQDKIKEHERHIEEVRQKAVSMNHESCKENLSG